MSYIVYLRSIKNELQRTGRAKKNLRVKTIMENFGYQRRSQAFIDDFNAALLNLGLCANPAFDLYIPLDTKIAFSIQGVAEEQSQEVENSEPICQKMREPIAVKHDFFYYLFDFGSEEEYERFQACLDSNQPVGIFLIPQAEDFFSDVAVKIFSYELIRKYQYRGNNDIPKSSNRKFSTNIVDSDEEYENNQENAISDASIFHFYRSTMTSVILGTTGIELLDSEKFDEQFEQISLYANKYNSAQFFILFHCPSASEIQSQQKEDALGHLVDRVARKIPFTFTLRCKYLNEASIEQREEIYAHFRLLLELPYYEMEEDDVSLLNYFLELQKAQIQAELQLFMRMKVEHFYKLKWQEESTEYIYLKYFAIKTLESIGYELTNINCEVELTSADEEETTEEDSTEEDEEYQSEIIQVYVKNKVIVEIETLKYQEFEDNNLFFDMIKRIIRKSKVWPNKLESVWLVLPGFEIARNYYQVKKTKEILEYKLAEYYGDGFQIIVMTPDYEKYQLAPVSFDEIDYPSFEFKVKKPRLVKTYPITKHLKLDFSQVKGLNEEKEKLSKLLRLQIQGHKGSIGGILFYGLPGCGKTLLANAFANESGRYFFKFSPADIVSVWIGQSQKNIRDIFAQAKKKAPSVLFIDELDSIGFNRSDDNAHTDQKATINQLLIELSNIKDSDVIVIAATNYLGGIDSALKRSGRLDWKIPIFPPDQSERQELFKYYLSQIDINIYRLVNFEILAEASTKFTSSDIELVCREVSNALILEEINSALTTSDVISYINNLQDGGLSLTQEQVKEFLDECKRLSVKNPKLETLSSEWGLDQE
jgi:AAA+ superfamily predicted ATPase